MIIFGKTHRIYHEVLSHPGGKVKNPTVEGWTGRLAGGPESHRCLGLEWYVVLNVIDLLLPCPFGHCQALSSCRAHFPGFFAGKKMFFRRNILPEKRPLSEEKSSKGKGEGVAMLHPYLVRRDLV